MAERIYPEPTDELTSGTIIITEETVEIDDNNYFDLINQNVPTDFIPPVELEVLLNNKAYILKCTHAELGGSPSPYYYYGDIDGKTPIFDQNPVVLLFGMNFGNNSGLWSISTSKPGTYTISAKVPGAVPKVLSFPKGRTIVSELSRLNKAFGTVSKKKTIIGQLSDLADAAEAGKIGGGSGEAFMVHVNGKDTQVLDKTWQEIYDALKTTSVYIIRENEEEMFVSTQECIIEAAYNNPDGYIVHTSLDDYYSAASPDDYPMTGGK